MTEQAISLGSSERPLRVAVVGSGPAGFYAADFILKGKHAGEKLTTEVDVFERLPSPFGLVRSGVAPDHQDIKKVTKAFERIASHEKFRFFGNVDVGTDVTHEELLQHYDQVLYAVGSATDRRMGIPGEDLEGSHAATTFVGWYNGHPDFKDQSFDFTSERAIVVGLGNVAMDVTRILVRDPDELAETDIASYALQALRKSRIKEVVLLGRRGAAQAAFTPREIKDIAELSGVQLVIDGDASELGTTEGLSGPAKQNVEFLTEVKTNPLAEEPRRVRVRFLCSPVEVLGDGKRVTGVKVENNQLVDDGSGRLRARGTGEYDELDAGLIFRSIGYRGTAQSSVPFDEKSGTIPNQAGRVLDAAGGSQVPAVYTVGWIKRGPSGLIGTNKSCAKETAESMLADAAASQSPKALPDRTQVEELLLSRKVRVIDIASWRAIDEQELANGKKQGKVREKFYTSDAMLGALGG